MRVALKAKKYFCNKCCFVTFQIVMVLNGNNYNQSLAFSTKANGNILSFTHSSVVPLGFMLEKITWNSFRCFLGSSPTRPWKVWKRWIISNFNSKESPLSLHLMYKDCWAKAHPKISLRVWFGLFTTISSWLDWFESSYESLESEISIAFSILFC